MAPKRRKVVGSVVRTKTTSKVVKETVEVSLVETDNSEPQLTQEEENRETDEREEERAEIDLSVGKTPTRVIAVQGPEAKLKPEEQPPEKEPEYATPPEDVVEDQFPLMDEDHEDGEKETEKGEHEGREGKPAPEDQAQPEEQEEEEETQDIAQKEVEAAMDETGETPSEEEQGKPAPEDQVQPEEQEEEEETQNIAQREVEAAMDETGETPSEEEQGKQQEQEQVKQGEAASGKEEIKGKKRGRKRRRVKRMGMGEREGYKRYIHRVLKQVHPELGISSNAITVLDGFMKDMFQRLASEASNLTKYTEKMTVSSREVQAAVRLVLPGELGKHAVVEGTKAVSNYMSYDEGVAEKKKKA